MFDIGFSELFVIAVVALVVLGPKRLPNAARFAGLWVRRARAQWHSVKSELERELGEEQLRRSLSQAREERSRLAARVARAELSGRLISWSSERVVVESRRGRPKAPGSRDRD